jgi:defect in organelle trafficking protein DotA
MMNRHLKRLFWVLLLFFPALVFAEGTTNGSTGLSFTPGPNDLSVILLSNIFGMVDGVLHGTGSQILGQMFGVFNSAVLGLGVTLMGYTTMTAVLKTAHEGEPMGKQWSSLWIPIRSATGMALLIPKASGYCAVQIFIMWVVVQGCGAADAVWAAALNYLGAGGVIVQQNQPTAGGGSVMQTAGSILASEVCMYELQYEMQQYLLSGSAGYTVVPSFTSTLNVVVDSATTGAGHIKFPDLDNDTTGLSGISGVCGNVVLPDMTMGSLQSTAGGVSNVLGASFSAGNGLSPGFLTLAQQSRMLGLQQIVQDLMPTAQAIVTNYNPPPNVTPVPPMLYLGHEISGTWGTANGSTPLLQGTEIGNAANDFTNIMNPVLNELSQGGNVLSQDTVNSAISTGWILGGAYYFDLTLVNNNVTNLSGKTVAMTYTPPPSNFNNTNDSSTAYGAITYGTLLTSLQSILGSGNINTINNIVNNYPDFGTIPPNPGSPVSGSYLGDAVNMSLSNGNQGYLPDLAGNVNAVGAAGGFAASFAFIIGPIIMMMLDFITLLTAQQSNANPIICLSAMGNNMLMLVVEIWIGLGVTFTLASLGLSLVPCFDLAEPVGVFVEWVTPFVMALCSAMFLSGMTMAYYIPLIPYIIFTFGALGWMIGVIEAMVAGPVVAIGIAHPEGHDVFGKAEPAIFLLANVFLRPMLMIFGLFAGIILSYVGVWLVNDGFAQALMILMEGVQGWSVIFVPIVIIIIYMGIVLAIMNKSFTLIYVVPDKVLRWIQGGQQEALGAEAAGMADQVKGTFQAGTGAIESGASKGMSAMQEAGRAGAAKNKGGDDAATVEPIGPEKGGHGPMTKEQSEAKDNAKSLASSKKAGDAFAAGRTTNAADAFAAGETTQPGKEKGLKNKKFNQPSSPPSPPPKGKK